MKKILATIIGLILLSSMVVASNGEGEQNKILDLENIKAQIKSQVQSEVVSQVMEQVQTQHRERLQLMANIMIEESDDGEVIVKGKEEKKFLGLFKIQKRVEYKITENGELVRNRNMFDFLFKE